MKFEIRNKRDEFVSIPRTAADRFEIVGQHEGQYVWEHVGFWPRRSIADREIEALIDTNDVFVKYRKKKISS